MNGLKMFLPIVKVDAEKRLVYGVATAEAEDRSGEICDYSSTKPYYEAWSAGIEKSTNGKSLGNVRAMHGTVAAGKVTQLNFNDDSKQIEVCAKVVDDAEWNKVVEGVYTGFSQGGSYVKRWKDDAGLQRYTADPSEISLVDLPCLPSATFEVIKADGVAETKHFKSVIAEPTAAEVAAKAVELAKEAGADAKWADYIGDARDALVKAATSAADTGDEDEDGPKWTVNSTNSQGNKAPESKHTSKADADEEAADRKSKGHTDVKVASADKAAPTGDLTPTNVGPDIMQGWQAKDGSFHAKRADAVARNAKIAAEAVAKAAAAPVLAQLAEMNDTLGLTKKDYSEDERKKMAESGEAKSDGSYPIKTAKDVENAVKDYNRSSGSASDKKHIIARAKAIDATDKLPADWEGSTAGDDKSDKAAAPRDLKKGLPTVMRLACIIEDLKWLHDAVLVEEGDEGDAESALPAMAKENLQGLCDFLVAMVNEETTELLQGQDDDALYSPLVVDYVVCDYGYWCASPRDAADALIKALKIGPVRKRLNKVLSKIGARNNRADQDKIQAVHDHACDLGASCNADNCEDDDADKIAGGDLAKAELAKVTAERDALQKTLTETIVPQLAEIKKKVDVIAAQPVPVHLQGRAVSKTGIDETDADLAERISKMSQEEISLMLIKASQQSPHVISTAR